MGRHVEASGTPFDLRRLTQIAGLVGGVVWVLAYFLPDDGAAETTLLTVGAVLLTIALCGLGLLLVRSDFLALRIFVAIAVPVLVWSVIEWAARECRHRLSPGLDQLSLSPRLRHVLQRHGYDTIADVERTSDVTLLLLSNSTARDVHELRRAIFLWKYRRWQEKGFPATGME
jgi:hypothetical protein